ncbi:MAG: exodeoxyribonuclease V subunit gamma [Balneolaceae bacterium]
MLYIRKSDKLNILANQIAGNLDQTEPADPMTPVTIIVPNRDTARWLSMELAERRGIAANLDYQLPSEWIWNSIRSLRHLKDLPEQLPSDLEPMTWTLFELLREDRVLSQFENLAYYLRRKEEETIENFSWQLAEKLAGVFDQYLVYRPQMLLRWERNDYQSNDEIWQGKLWNLLVKKWKGFHNKIPRQHRGQLFQLLIKAVESDEADCFSPVHHFNPGLMAQPYLRLISVLHKKTDVYLYQIHPFKNLWTVERQDENSSELLASQGMEFKEMDEMLKTWIPKSAAQIERTYSTPPEERTNLSAVQESIVNNKNFPELKKEDRSIIVRACHSPLREVETLHRFLLKLFDSEVICKNLTPDEVLVVTPNLQDYTPFIESVFGTAEIGIPEIPFHLPTSVEKKTAGYLYAFHHLLQLPDSRFSYEDVMGFIQHSVIRRKFQISDSDFSTIKKWTDDNGVIWGLNAEHRHEFQQPFSSRQTWSAAMKRGWTGQLAGGEPGHIFDRTLLYHGVQTIDEQRLWARFQNLLTLLADIKKQTERVKNVKNWCELVKKWIMLFLPDDHPESLKPLLDRVNKLQRQVETAGFDKQVSYSLIRSLITSDLDEMHAGSAIYSRGLVFSSMIPVKSIPFRVIALLGLNDDYFPRRPVKPEFDLIAQDPRMGERNRLHEDRNLFLESVLAAQDVHYCSFIGRDQKDNEPIPPSPILGEWINLIETNHPGSFYREERLNGFSEEYFKEGTGISNVFYEVASTLRKNDKVKGLRIEHSIDDYENIYNLLTINELEKFFKNPVKLFFKNRLDVVLDDPEKDIKEEFSSDVLDRHLLFQHLFGWKLQEMENERIEILLQHADILPAGWPGRKTFQELDEAVDLSIRTIKERFGELSVSEYEIDHSIGTDRVEGTIQSYLSDHFLDLTPSKLSGTSLLQSWIRHLILSASIPERKYKESTMLYGLRKGKPEWRRFKPVEDPGSYLKDLFALYKMGMKQPLALFPKSSWTYIENINKEDAEKAIRRTLNTWGGSWGFSERSDPYIELWLGQEPELKGKLWEQFVHYSDRIYQPLYRHLEELS